MRGFTPIGHILDPGYIGPNLRSALEGAVCEWRNRRTMTLKDDARLFYGLTGELIEAALWDSTQLGGMEARILLLAAAGEEE